MTTTARLGFSDETDVRTRIRRYHRVITTGAHIEVAPLVREAIESVHQSLGAELAFDIFLVLDGCEVRFVMEPV